MVTWKRSATALAAVLLMGCEPTCQYENDGMCDPDYGFCPVGTDLADCAARDNGNGNGSGGGGGSGGSGGTGSGPPGGANACPGVTYPDDFEAWDSDSGLPPPGWNGPPDTTIQVTSHCSISCLYAFEFGPNSSEVQQTCAILLSFYPQVHRGQELPRGWCPVCDQFR